MKLIRPCRYENRQRFDLASLQHSKDFQNLDQRVQNLINNVSKESKDFEELRNKESKENIGSGFREHERRRAEREQHTRLLESLWFSELHFREETITEAYKKTFQWIFDKSGRAVRPWSNFTSWLEDGEGIYWISGKAGSGKSTLMNFLCQDERTKEQLEIWSGSKDILMVKFFFWSAGTMMQKNFDGFLRSLLWQILSEYPDIGILQTSTEPSSEEERRRTSYSQGSIGVWTKRRLLETLHGAMNKLQNSCYLCFFIDGLDEFDDDKDDLIEFVQDIVSNTGVKVCLSSRPRSEFEVAFGSSARLRLQDLTNEDIRGYVNDTFQRVPQLVSMASVDKSEINKLKKQIVDRAECVFLWVFLAVKDQIRGLRNDDSPEQLQQRLAWFPSEIEGVYARMLDQIDKTYLQEASSFLKMALDIPKLSVLDLALASYPGLEDMITSADVGSERRVVLLCQSTRKKLITRCVGFLEAHEDPHQEDTDEENTNHENADQEDIERQTVSDRTYNFGAKQLESSSKVEMSISDFQRETRDDFDRENELGQPHREPDKSSPASSSKPEMTDAKTLKLESARSVYFTHPTVVDFLKYPGPGKAFLDINLPPGFDPGVRYFKAELAVKRLMEELNQRKATVQAENKNFTASASGRESPTFYSQTSFVDSGYASNRAYSTSNSSIELEQAAHSGEKMSSRVTDDEIQSLASDQDETQSQEYTGRLPQAAIAIGLLANLLAKNNELSPLYKEALSLMEVRRFVNNFQRLLRQCYLDLRQNAKGNLEVATCRLLKGQEHRKKIAERIAGLHQPENDETREIRKRQADEDRTRAYLLERWIAINQGLRHVVLSADTPGPVPDDTLQDQEEDSSEEDASEDGNGATNLPHISEMESFVTGGDAFQNLVTNFRIFLLPTSLRSLARVIMSVPTDRICFVESDDLSLSNKMKMFVENITEDNWNWWPLRAKMKRLQKDQTRLLWQCVSDTSNRVLRGLLKIL